MLYDQNRDKFPTLYKFIAFCRSKAGERYDWYDTTACPAAQFFETENWSQKNGDTQRAEGWNPNHLAYVFRLGMFGRFDKLAELAEAQLVELVS